MNPVLMIVIFLTGLSASMPDGNVTHASAVEAVIRTGEEAKFDNCIIVDDLILCGQDIKKPVHFNNTTFRDNANFDQATFNSDAFFRSSTFKSEADFSFSTFKSDADFSSSTFNSTAGFWSSTFKSDADFQSSTFHNMASFSSSNFTSDAGFEKCSFDKEALFNDVVFKGNTCFNRSQFKGDALFEGASFDQELSLTRTKYDKLYINWSDIKQLTYDESAYQLLIENFKKLGFNRDADNCYYEFRLAQLLHWGGSDDFIGILVEKIRNINSKLIYKYNLGDRLMHVLDFGAWILYGYGKRPLYPLAWSIITILLFGVYWWHGGLGVPQSNLKAGIFERYGSKRTAVLRNRSKKRNWRGRVQSISKAMLFSATIFLSGTRLFIDPPSLPEMPRWSQFKIKTIFTTERVLGAFFSILFIFATGATVIRQ